VRAVSIFTLIAKAGGSGEGSENTLSAVQAALAVPAPRGFEIAVEVDVRLSADGVPVVIHDARLERTTSGRGLVRAHAVAELRRLQTGSGEAIPRLDEVLELCRGRTLVIDAHDAQPETAERLFTTLRRQGESAIAHAIVASEHGRLLGALRAREPRLRTSASKLEAYQKLLCSRLGVARFGPRGRTFMVPVRHAGIEIATARFVSGARRFGDDVWVFVVDDAAELGRLRALGVTGCFSTRPGALARALGPPA